MGENHIVMKSAVIPVTHPVYALYFRCDPDNERDAVPVVAWLYELGPHGSHYLRGFVIDCNGGMSIAEETENFDRYSFESGI